MASNPVPREGERNESTYEPEVKRIALSERLETEGGTMRENSGPNEAQCSGEGKESLYSDEEEELPGDRAGAMAEAVVSNKSEVQYFQRLLDDKGIWLPEGVLTQKAVDRSRDPDVIKDAKLVKEALVNMKIDFNRTPRLACRDVKNALDLMDSNNARGITEKIFFKRGGAGLNWPHPEYEKKTEDECLDYFKQEILPEVGEGKIQSHQVKYEKEKTVEFGFLNGRMDFLTTVTNSSIQEIIIECKSTRKDMMGKVFKKPREGHRAKLIKKHRYYYQTLSYKYILQNLLNTDPDRVQAVMVLRNQSGDNQPEFYWGKVDGDLEQIHRLNEFCTEEALPRFLALLQLMDQPGTSSVDLSDEEDE